MPVQAREYLSHGDIVAVDCSHQCNVLVMDDANFQNYRTGGQFRYSGGFYKRLPAVITVPHSGHWNTIIDVPGGQAQFRYNIGYRKRAA